MSTITTTTADDDANIKCLRRSSCKIDLIKRIEEAATSCSSTEFHSSIENIGFFQGGGGGGGGQHDDNDDYDYSLFSSSHTPFLDDDFSSLPQSRKTTTDDDADFLNMSQQQQQQQQQQNLDLSISETSSNNNIWMSSSRRRPHTSTTTIYGGQEDFKLDKLRFDDLGLFGRDQEQQILQDSLYEVSQNNIKKFVLINGPSGSGKSHLAITSLSSSSTSTSTSCGSSGTTTAATEQRQKQKQKQQQQQTVVYGKFDAYQNEPYSGIICAFNNLIRQIASSQRTKKALKLSLQSELVGAEILTITKLLPSLLEILLLDDDDDDDATDIKQNLLLEDSSIILSELEEVDCESKYRIQHSFRVFMRIACTVLRPSPVALILDDLQWADRASLDLLETLLSTDDKLLPGFLVVGCSRTDDVNTTSEDFKEEEDEDSELRNMILRLSTTGKTSPAVTTISLGNLSADDVSQVLSILLSIDDSSSRIHELANLCHKRTMGNFLYFLRFCSMLWEENLIQFKIGIMDWKWNVNRIAHETSATENIVDMVKRKMERLDPCMMNLLRICACVGSSFDIDSIRSVWLKLMATTTRCCHAGKLESLVSEAVTEQFIEKDGSSSNRFRWTHDVVRESAIALEVGGDQNRLQYEIGMILFENHSSCPQKFDSMIFIIADLINKKPITHSSVSKRTDIARINLLAAEKAKALASYEISAAYARVGISGLTDDSWTRTFRLTRDLYSVGAEVEGILGNIDRSEEYCNEVIGQHSCSVVDKLRVINSWIITSSNKADGGTLEAGLDLSLQTLDQLGCSLPTNSVKVGIGAVSSVLSIKSQKYCKLLLEVNEQPLMVDPIKVACMKLLEKVAVYAFLSKHFMLSLLAIKRMIKWTKRYGMCEYSPPAFAQAGTIMLVLGDYKRATLYSEAASIMLERFPSQRMVARTFNSVQGVFAWQRPLQLTLKPLFSAYKIGVQIGDLESATVSIWFQIVYAFLAGKSLQSLHAAYSMYVPQMDNKQCTHCCLLARLHWQCVQNLTGVYNNNKSYTRNNLTLSGSAIGTIDEVETLELLKNSELGFAFFPVWKSVLCAYYGNHEEGAKLAIKRGDSLAKNFPAFVLRTLDCFCRGLSLFAMARNCEETSVTNSTRRKYRNAAKQCLRQMRKWLRDGNPNVQQYTKILEAENAMLNGKIHQAQTLYRKAVILSAKSGFVQDAALASERLAESLKRYDPEEAEFCLGNAIQYYQEWGALQKVQDLFGDLELTQRVDFSYDS